MKLEHFQKNYSHSVWEKVRAVFLVFGFVSAQLQGLFKPAPSPKPRQNPKILAPNGYSFSSNAPTLLIAITLLGGLNAFAGEFPDTWTWDDTPEKRAAHVALEGKPMPALHVTDWINGGISADAIKGKVVVIDLYATWCGPCMAAIPHNNELLKKYKDQGLVIIGVCTHKKGQETFVENAKQHGLQYPAARDPELKTQAAYGVHYYPTYAIIDRKGIVRVIGLQPHHVEAVIQKLLAEPAP